jgi:hypothetical protein
MLPVARENNDQADSLGQMQSFTFSENKEYMDTPDAKVASGEVINACQTLLDWLALQSNVMVSARYRLGIAMVQ